MKTEKPNNPFAFSYATPQGNGIVKQNGMTLRDYFANSAMIGLISNEYVRKEIDNRNDTDLEMKKDIAVTSYELADAMLKQREL